MLVKQPTEIQRIVIAYGLGNLCNVVIGVFQQVLGVHHSQGQNILHRSNLYDLFKISDEPTGAEVSGFGVLFNVDFSGIVFIKIMGSAFDCVSDVAARFLTFFYRSVHKQEDMT